MDTPKNPGWERSDGSVWARPEHVSEIKGPRESQDRVRLSPELVKHIRHDEEESQDDA
jgi:hypothetical protein